MTFHLRAATDQDCSFARVLTRQSMDRYYEHYGFIWSNDGFDTAWAGRESWMICRDDKVIGFISLSYDDDALFIRELHLIEASRGRGAGSWVLEQMVLKARTQGLGFLRHFPMCELRLGGLGVVEGQRAQDQSVGEQRRLHGVYQVAVFGRFKVPRSTKRMVPNSPPASLPRNT